METDEGSALDRLKELLGDEADSDPAAAAVSEPGSTSDGGKDDVPSDPSGVAAASAGCAAAGQGDSGQQERGGLPKVELSAAPRAESFFAEADSDVQLSAPSTPAAPPAPENLSGAGEEAEEEAEAEASPDEASRGPESQPLVQPLRASPRARDPLDFSAFPAEPIPLIAPDDDEGAPGGYKGTGQMVVNEAALAMLRAVEVPLAVVAVAGLYRTGKSSLLNWLCDPEVNAAFNPVIEKGFEKGGAAAAAETASEAEGQAKAGGGAEVHALGFAVGATVQRCTRGIWIWGRPRPVRLAGGGLGALVILDTEGLGSVESEGRYDARIFALATLLSSTLVYNSLGTIDEKAISSLSFVAQLTQNIRLDLPTRAAQGKEPKGENSGGGDERGSAPPPSPRAASPLAAASAAASLAAHFPSFVWVVRDFALELEDSKGNAITPDQYLEGALRPQAGFDASTGERNKIRAAVTSFFRERKTVTLVRPLHDETRLQQVDEVPFADLRAEFRADFSKLQACLLQEAKPKTLRPPNHRAAAIGPSVILREPCLAVQFSVHTFDWFVSLRATL